MKKVLLLLAVLPLNWPLVADPGLVIDIVYSQFLGTEGTFLGTEGTYARGFVGAQMVVDPVAITGSFSMQNDGKYGPPIAGFWDEYNGTLGEGGVQIDTLPFSARVGRFVHSDLVDSPYSLFISSAPLVALQAELRADTPNLFFVSRWIELNRGSAPQFGYPSGYPDRGAAFKAIGMTFGNLRVAFQDAAVYVGRSFDLEYLINPTPGFVLQYFRSGGDSPAEQVGNDNSIVGLIVDYRPDDLYLYGQFLIDDFSLNRFVAPESYQNPDKIAWSLGGHYDSPIGRFGLYHAGATKYTFQAYGGGSVGSATDTKYGYIYFPATEYTVGGDPRTILPEENYIGYLHGENNIAFLLAYDPWLRPIGLHTELEMTVSGAKSPANPWHEFNSWSDDGQGPKFLDSERLETKLMSRTRAMATFGRWSFEAGVTLGVTINALELTDVPSALAGTNNDIRYFVPGTSTVWHAGLDLSAGVSLGPLPEKP